MLTDVTTRELETKLEEQLGDATKALRNLRKDAVVLQSLDKDWLREVLFRRPNREELLAELEARLRRFLEEAGYENVSAAELSAGPVLESYFEGRPPFGGKKKHEFPDAFALMALETWCEKAGQSIYIVSDDGDWKDACEGSPSLVYAADLAEVLELALEDKGVQIDMAHAVFSRLRDEVEELVRETWEDLDILTLDEVDAEVSEVRVKTVDLDSEKVVQQAGGRADYSLYAEISFEAAAEYYPSDDFVWDSETKTAVYFEKVRRRIERTVEIPVEVTVWFDPGDLQSGTIQQVVVNRNAILMLETEDWNVR